MRLKQSIFFLFRQYFLYIRKDFTISYRIEDSFYDDPDYLEKIAAAFFQLKRFADFVNYMVDDME